jgi:hypothetical protein
MTSDYSILSTTSRGTSQLAHAGRRHRRPPWKVPTRVGTREYLIPGSNSGIIFVARAIDSRFASDPRQCLRWTPHGTRAAGSRLVHRPILYTSQRPFSIPSASSRATGGRTFRRNERTRKGEDQSTRLFGGEPCNMAPSPGPGRQHPAWLLSTTSTNYDPVHMHLSWL